MSKSGEDAYLVEEDFLSIGRTFEEYRRLFAIDVADVVAGPVLDCAAGPSSFAAVASAVGAEVTAVDPVYARPLDELEAECAAAVERTEAQLREKRDRFEWEFYGDLEARCRLLRAAYERFLADYARNPDRYVGAGLPALPFESNAFDLVLSAHFLFLYDDRLSLAFHVAACRELARVASGEVRIFPLVALDYEPSAYVEDVVSALREDGLTAGPVEVPFEFQPGATEALVVSDVSDYAGPDGRSRPVT